MKDTAFVLRIPPPPQPKLYTHWAYNRTLAGELIEVLEGEHRMFQKGGWELILPYLWEARWKSLGNGSGRSLLEASSKSLHLLPFSGPGAGFHFLPTPQKARPEVSKNRTKS